jgi:DNA invertase Pin-like site-specific DNA recombinase
MAIPVAQYLRMSTEHQQYSICNQMQFIAEYAEARGFSIVRTFEDPGKSGLCLKSRPALRQLLNEVMSGNAAFKAILVYDVSRWGRFQDVDESAHYEFLCRSAGIPIHYCAEQFINQGSIESAILKTLKRAMAAEFSRELGEKVFRGQQQLVKHGFKMGGRSTYGLRRMLVSVDGKPKQLLARGERKSIHNDRVVIVPGPEGELQIVREIFTSAIGGKNPSDIARELNTRGIPFSARQQTWKPQTVANLIRNPVYAGCNTWGRTTQRLKGGNHDLPSTQWMVVPGTVAAIVPPETFDAAREAISWKLTDEEVLEGLKQALKKHGAVTEAILAADRDAPSYMTCKYHFGTLKAALENIGYSHRVNYSLARKRGKQIQRVHRQLVNKIARRFPTSVQIVSEPHSPKRLLLVDETIRVRIQFATPRQTSPGSWAWRICPRKRELNELNLCCYLDTQEQINCMYILRCLPASNANAVTIHPESTDYPHFRVKSLGSFCRVAREVAAG